MKSEALAERTGTRNMWQRTSKLKRRLKEYEDIIEAQKVLLKERNVQVKQELDDLKIEQKQNEAKHQELHAVIEEKKVHIQKLTNDLKAQALESKFTKDSTITQLKAEISKLEISIANNERLAQ